MADNKEIRIKAIIDTADLDAQISRIKQKMTQATSSAQTLQRGQSIGAFSPQTQALFAGQAQKSFHQLREEFNLSERQSRNMEKDIRNITSRANSMKDIATKEKEVNKLLEDREKIENRLMHIKKAQVGFLEQAKTIDPNLSGFRMAGGTQGPEALAGGGNFNIGRMQNYRGFRGMGFGQGLSRLLSSMGGPIGVLGGLGAVASTGANIGMSVADELAERQRNIAMAQGSAMSMAATPLRQQMAGRGYEAAIFAPERERAFDTVGKEMESRRARDITRGLKDAVSEGLSQGFKFAIAGAAGGALAGGVGAGPGAIGGGLLGFGMGAFGKMADKGFRGALFNTQEYKAGLTREGFEKQQQLEQAYKLLNMDKTLGFEELQQNMGFYKGFGRTFGTSRPTTRGGLLGGILGAGVSRESGTDIATQMMGASGMTTGPGQVGDIKQAFMLGQGGMTNAGTVVGRMRGLMGGMTTQGIDEAMRRLFSEAMKAGINDSKMVEEMRKFTDVTSDLAYRQGGSDIANVASEFGRGMIGTGGRDIQAAGAAYQMRNQETGKLGGLEGAMKFAFSGSTEGKEILGGLSGNFEDTSAFLGLNVANLDPGNPQVKYLMSKMGITDFGEFKGRWRKAQTSSTSPRGGTRELMTKLGGLTSGQDFEAAVGGGGEAQDVYGQLIGALGVERGEGFRTLGQREQESYIRSLVTGETPADQVGGAGLKSAFEQRGAESPFTKLEAATAADQRESMGRLDDNIDQFAKAAENSARGAGEVNKAMELFKGSIGLGVESMNILRDAMVAIREYSQGGDKASLDAKLKALQSKMTDQPITTGNSSSSIFQRRMSGR